MPRNPSGSCGGSTTTLHGGFDRKGHRNSPSNYRPSSCCLDSHVNSPPFECWCLGSKKIIYLVVFTLNLLIFVLARWFELS